MSFLNLLVSITSVRATIKPSGYRTVMMMDRYRNSLIYKVFFL